MHAFTQYRFTMGNRRIGKLLDGKMASEDDLKAIGKLVKEEITKAAEYATTSPEPDPTELYTDVLDEVHS